ncbi:MAG: ABC transporter substrate-binding protein [Angelakisella sp.]
MKRSKTILAALMACALVFTMLGGCGAAAPAPAAPAPAPAAPAAPATPAPAPAPTPAPAPAAPAEMTHDELVAAAQKEGKVVVYSATSRAENAGKAFEAKYGIKVEVTNLKDFELIEKLAKEGQTGAIGADMAICQDDSRVFGELMKPGYLVNYVPPTMKDVIPAEYQEPMVFAFISKVFCFNNEKGDASPATNVWAFADPDWKGRFQFKDPFKEGVNSNFLTMVTSPEVSKQLEAAYEKHYGKKIELTTENAGYEWIKRIYANGLVQGTSDTTMAENIGIKGQPKINAGLFSYSKTRYDESKNLALKAMDDLQPFAGFYYPLFSLITKDAKNPNAAKLFIEYILTEEGFAPWGKDKGTYSTNPNIAPAKDDVALKEWAPKLVKIDPEFCFEKRADVEDFLNNGIIY